MSTPKTEKAKSTKPGAFKPGSDARRGRGPKPGSGGRPPDEFKARMQGLASNESVEGYLTRCLNGEFGPKFFLGALGYVTDRGYGKAAQPISGSAGEPLEIILRRE